MSLNSTSSYLTLVSVAFFMPVWSSVNSGSTRMWMMMSLPRAEAAFSLTDLWGSFNAFRKVVCS